MNKYFYNSLNIKVARCAQCKNKKYLLKKNLLQKN